MEFVPKALILEDQDLKYDLRESLKRGGFNIRIARSVNNLIALADADHYDASIIDIRLTKNGTEGLEAISRLRAIKPYMYLEVLTAYKEFGQQARELGADNISFKPGGVKGLATRVKRGILEKGLSVFTDELGIDRISVDHLDVTNSDYQSAKTILNAEILTKCVLDINSFLDSYASDLGLGSKDIERIKGEIMNIMVKQLMNRSISETPKKDKTLDPALANNKNYLGFIEHRSELEKNYLDMYVAFVDGKFFDANYDLLVLHKQLDNKHAQDDAFVKKISKKEKVISFRRPRRIIRS
jgi:ActR/RegA family two-component response regulator